eukprot:TRINITY_DN151_c0_g1_i1.p1 TRINITY_DN151_c0_g1~~TRINITY_DN151_c0_g1_i1.p1  ORF type:complete len:133 (-),score=48.75 TRINITY_DN151_c0_g1_i1:105-503(-)
MSTEDAPAAKPMESSPAKAKKEKSLQNLDHRKLFKEGQKNLTPPVSDSTRAFYESLLEENAESILAIRFCVEYGVKPLEEHKKLLKKYNHLKDKGAFSVAAKIKRALEKKATKGADGVKKDKKEKKEKKEKA